MSNESIRIANEFENTHRLERRLAAINHNYVAFVTNKAFTEYFGCDHFENVVSYVHPDEQEQFRKFVDHYHGVSECKGFHLRLADGTYRYNIVKLLADSSNLGDHINIEMIDIEGAVSVNQKLIDDVTKIRVLLGMTDEYTFCYSREDNIFYLYRYEQYQRTVIYNMDIDDWEKYLLDNHCIAKEDEAQFRILINDIKNYEESFSVNINTSLRTQNDIMENLRFRGVVFHTSNQDKLVIGRVIITDDANQQQSLKILDELHYDSLTNVYNKKSITDYATKTIQNTKNRVTIVILDVDHFKSVNDTYGHLYGDKVLARVGTKLKNIVGDEGVVGRIGGDEFLIILNNTNDDQTLRSMLRAIRTQIKWEFADDFEDFMVTCSIGAAIYPNNGTNFEELFNKADYCLYVAKEKGRDRYVFFRDELHRQSFERTFANKIQGPQSNCREIKELQFIREFMLQSVTDYKLAFELARDHMMGNYKVDSIRIYLGPEFKQVYSYGHILEHAEEATYVNSDEFKRLLDGNTYIEIGFFSKLEANAPEFCRIMRERKILSTIQCIIGTPDHVVGLIVFDKCKEASQWADYEVNCAVIVSAMLSRLALEKEK